MAEPIMCDECPNSRSIGDMFRHIDGKLERVARMDEKLERVMESIYGSERHGDIGLDRRLCELERNAITKGQVAAFTAFVSAVTAVVTSVFHGWFSGK